MPATPELVYAINAGAEEITMSGIVFHEDRFSTAGTGHTHGKDIANAPANGVYQSERYGTYSYEIPVTDASYNVVLYVAESYQDQVGGRVFNVTVEGNTVASNYDLVAEVGAFAADELTIEDVAVSDGYLTVSVESIVENATLSGIAIYSTDGEFVEPPPTVPEPPVLPDPTAATPENMGSDCDVSGLVAVEDLAVNPNLPDPFTKLDGNRMTAKSEWRCRRQEIQREAEAYMYGFKPPKPEKVTGSVTSDAITVNVENGGKMTSFTAEVDLPDGDGPFPVLFMYSSFAHAALAKAEGVAVVKYNPYDVGAESLVGGSRASKKGAFYDIYGSDSETGLLVAWGWGVSRLIDVIEASDGSILRAADTAVTGCSRFGKGAFIAGAFDQRIDLTIPFESGSGGVPIMRGIPGEGAQSPSSVYGEEYWLGDAFKDFDSNTKVKKLPVDTHEVVGMVAPRGLLILDNPHIDNLGPLSAHVAALGGAEIYKALGAEANISYQSNVASGTHCSARPEFEQPLRDNFAKFLLHTGDVPGEMNPYTNKTGDLSSWIDWTTPTLAD